MNKKRGLPIGINSSNFDLTSAYVELNKKISEKIKQNSENFMNEIDSVIEDTSSIKTNKNGHEVSRPKEIEIESQPPKKQKKKMRDSRSNSFEIEFSNKKQCVEKESPEKIMESNNKMFIKNKWTEGKHTQTKSEFVSNDGINLRLSIKEGENFKQNLTNPVEIKIEKKIEEKIQNVMEDEEEEDSDSEMYIPDIF
jgi:hypothetical protein